MLFAFLLCLLVHASVQQTDPCTNGPCLNGGTCTALTSATGSSFMCTCQSGFSGAVCQTSDVCANNPCLNGGTCSPTSDSFSCTCANGFSGSVCHIGSGGVDCASSPCQNGGTCIPSVTGSFTCLCQNGFSGPTCQTSSDASGDCSSSPCQNGGTCIPSITGSYTCLCASGFSGSTCTGTGGSTGGGSCNLKTDKNNIGCVPAEIVFMIEYARPDSGFSSVDHEGDFIKALIDEWQVDRSHVRIGVVVYHDTVREAIHIDQYDGNNRGLKDAISRLTRTLRPSGTADLAKALDFVRAESFKGARPGVERIVVPIVHQMSDPSQQRIPAAAQALKDQCIGVLALAVESSNLERNILSTSVTQPSNSYLQYYTSYGAMENLVRFFYNARC